jgi:hypothetical protein
LAPFKLEIDLMSGIKDYSITPASNTALFPEGMAPSAVNDGMRQVQADIRSWYNDAQWIIFGDGDAAFAIAYVSPTSFSVTGADVTAVYHPGRRVKATGSLTGIIYGTIQTSAFATNTTVTVLWDAGSLQNEALTIAIGILGAANSAIPPAGTGAAGAVQLATQAETEAGASAAKAVTPAGLAPAAMTWTGPHVFQSADAGAGEIVAIDLDRASATPAANDLLMALRWRMRDGAGGTDIAAKLVAKLLDPAAGNEDAELQFATLVAGSLAARLVLGQGLYAAGAVGGDKGANTINASGLYQDGIPHAASDLVLQSGATHSPTLADHGKTFIYTNAGGCVVTLPAIAGLFSGFKIGAIVASGAGAVTFNRSGSDTIWSKNAALTTLKLPSPGDSGFVHVDAVNSKWYWLGKRSSTPADFGASITTATVTPHNLGVIPDAIRLMLVCTIANLNYAVNDVVDMWAATTSAGGGAVFIADATNVTTYTANGATSLPNKTTGLVSQITTADWNFRFTATVWN